MVGKRIWSACWIKHTSPDAFSLLGNISPFEFFDGMPVTPLDIVVPHVDDCTNLPEELDTLTGRYRQVLPEVRWALQKQHD